MLIQRNNSGTTVLAVTPNEKTQENMQSNKKEAHSSTTTTTNKTQYYYEIIKAFRQLNSITNSATNTTKPNNNTEGEFMKRGECCKVPVKSFLEAMRIFCRIFDALSAPFFKGVARYDIYNNISKMEVCISEMTGRNSADGNEEEEAGRDEEEVVMMTLEDLVRYELENGVVQSDRNKSGAISLLWMKRAMEFVRETLRILISNPEIQLGLAARQGYGRSLRYCHDIIMKGVFQGGILLAPSRKKFCENLVGGEDEMMEEGEGDERLREFLREFLEELDPVLDEIVEFYYSIGLENCIPHDIASNVRN